MVGFKCLAAVPLILAGFVAAGCKSRESRLHGVWRSAAGDYTIQLTDNHKATIPYVYGRTMDAVWTFDGKDVTITPVRVAWGSVAEAKAKFEAAAKTAAEKAFADDLDKPNVYSLSDDGATLTTDPSRDTNSGPPEVLTKDEALSAGY